MIETFLFFAASVIGMTLIIVDGSIMEGFRNWFRKQAEKTPYPHLGDIVSCYLCCGTWCGFFMGWVWVSSNPFHIFGCGCAGGFLGNLAAVGLNYLEAQSVVLPPQEVKDGD